MRISDKERHEIAGKLRNLMPEDASDDFFASSYLFHAMGFKYWTETAYDSGIENSGLTKTGLYKLADLIDIPTCVMTNVGGDFESSFQCSNCMSEFDMPDFDRYPYKRCPECGAVVQNAD